MAVVREHLMDFLRLVCDARILETPAAPWLARLPLMLDKQGRRVSLDDLKRRSKDGRKTPLKASVHPDRFQPLVAGYPDHMRMLFSTSDVVELGEAPPPAPLPDAVLRPEDPPRPRPPPRAPALLGPGGGPSAAHRGPNLLRQAWCSTRHSSSAASWSSSSAAAPADPRAGRALAALRRARGPVLRFHRDAAWELDGAPRRPCSGRPPAAAGRLLLASTPTAASTAGSRADRRAGRGVRRPWPLIERHADDEGGPRRRAPSPWTGPGRS